MRRALCLFASRPATKRYDRATWMSTLRDCRVAVLAEAAAANALIQAPTGAGRRTVRQVQVGNESSGEG